MKPSTRRLKTIERLIRDLRKSREANSFFLSFLRESESGSEKNVKIDLDLENRGLRLGLGLVNLDNLLPYFLFFSSFISHKSNPTFLKHEFYSSLLSRLEFFYLFFFF